MNLIDLLKRALVVDAKKVQLAPGRRVIAVLPNGPTEVKGEPQTSARIEELLKPVLSVEARLALAGGHADWTFEIPGCGTVAASAETQGGLRVTFNLEACKKPPGEIVRDKPKPVEAAGKLAQGPELASVLNAPLRMPEINGPNSSGSNAAVVRPRPEPLAETDAIEFAIPMPVRSAESKPLAPIAAQTHTSAAAVLDMPKSTTATSNGIEPQVASVRPFEVGATMAIDQFLERLMELRGSDLHLTTGAPPLTRVDGEMMPIPGFAPLSKDDAERILWSIVPARNREEFSETHDTDFAYELPGRARFRANLFLDLRGMGGVFRIIPSKILTTEDLGLPKVLLNLCDLPKGLVLVTGPTGSGKSTTLAALIDYINRTRQAHIITVEDPIEFVHPNRKCLVNQRQVGEHTGSFDRALRAALREDPDIILLGEMRDLETVSIALETAETGHLVFGTLHTSSAPSTIDRIIDQFPPEQQNQIRVMLANSLKGVVAQMLCKKVGGGRIAALEIMLDSPAISNLIREQKIFQIPSIIQTARSSGMCLLNDSLLKHVKAGLIKPEEALSKSYDRGTLITLLKQNNIAIPEPPAPAA